MLYSLWLQPKEPQIQSYLVDMIASLGKNYHGPMFEPHLTLLGNVDASLEKIQERCQTLTRTIKPIKLETGIVDYSTTYFQCVFVRIQPTPDLMKLYDATNKAFQKLIPSLYMPHISLFYGDIPYEKRNKMKQSIQFKKQHFTVSSIIVAGGNTPSTWKHFADIPFSKT